MSIILYPPSSPIAFNLFGCPIRYYGLIMSISFLIGISLVYFLIKKKYSIRQADVAFDYLPFIIFISIIGARLFYVIGSSEYYLSHPLEVIMINHGGLSLFGAIVFGLISLFIFAKFKKFDFLLHIDVIATVMPLCQAIGRYGNYFNQEAYGLPSNSLFQLFVEPIYRLNKFSDVDFFHPTFFYESCLDFIIFLVLLFLLFKKKTLHKGSIALVYLILYSVIRYFIEQIRIDSVMYIGSYPIAQILSLLFFFVSVFILIIINKKRPN